MKTIIRLGFMVWRRNHGGMRRIVREHQKTLSSSVKFRLALGIRWALIELSE